MCLPFLDPSRHRLAVIMNQTRASGWVADRIVSVICGPSGQTNVYLVHWAQLFCSNQYLDSETLYMYLCCMCFIWNMYTFSLYTYVVHLCDNMHIYVGGSLHIKYSLINLNSLNYIMFLKPLNNKHGNNVLETLVYFDWFWGSWKQYVQETCLSDIL